MFQYLVYIYTYTVNIKNEDNYVLGSHSFWVNLCTLVSIVNWFYMLYSIQLNYKSQIIQMIILSMHLCTS